MEEYENIIKVSKKYKAETGDIEDFYELGEPIGTGAYSVVLDGRDKRTKHEVAVKIVDKETMGEKGIKSVAAEVRVLSEVTHKNIVELIAIYESEVEYFLVLKRVKGGELFSKIAKLGPSERALSEKDASNIFRQILLAVVDMHARGFIHRDLKPENLLLMDDSPTSPVILIDFGLAVHVNDGNDLLSQVVGTPEYLAPEVLTCQLHGKTYSTPVDMWALGCILYILLSGKPPFGSDSQAELFSSIVKGNFSLDGQQWGQVSGSAKDLLKMLLEVDPEKRISAEMALNHFWVQGRGCSSAAMTASLQEMKRSIPKMKLQKKGLFADENKLDTPKIRRQNQEIVLKYKEERKVEKTESSDQRGPHPLVTSKSVKTFGGSYVKHRERDSIVQFTNSDDDEAVDLKKYLRRGLSNKNLDLLKQIK